MKRSVALLAALSGAVLLTGSACSSGDDPGPNYSSVSPTPTTSTSPTPTESPSPTGVPSTGPNVNPGEIPPTEPVGAERNDSDGAIAFAAYYVKTLDWVFATSAPDILQPFYSPKCTTCESRLTYLHSVFDDGGRLEGGRLAIKGAQIVDNDGRLGATVAVSIAVSVGAVSVLGSAGATASSDPGTDFISLTTWLVFDGGHWQVVEERYA